MLIDACDPMSCPIHGGHPHPLTAPLPPCCLPLASPPSPLTTCYPMSCPIRGGQAHGTDNVTVYTSTFVNLFYALDVLE